jgi:hypothetical protein
VIKCKICGRDFKSPQALGGHMRGAHREETQGGGNNAGNPENAAENIEPTGGETAPALAENSQAEQIRSYLKQGFTVKQLTAQFGFSESTVRQEIARLVKPEGEAIDEKANHQDNAWPVIRKMGGGVEIVAPEAVLKQYWGGTPEGEIELRAIMKFRAAMLMVMDLVNIQKGSAEADARRMEPILRLMKETREEQDAAAARARASSVEMAREAAQEAVGGVLGYIDQKIPQVPPPKTVDEAYAKRVDRVMDMMWNVMEQQMFPNKPLEGWETETKRLPEAETRQANPPEDKENLPPQGNLDGWEEEEKKEDE